MTKLWLSYRTTNLWRFMIIIIFFENVVIDAFLACLFNVHYLIFLSMVHEYAYFHENRWVSEWVIYGKDTNSILICCICIGGRCEPATCFSYKREGCTVSATSVGGLQRLTQFLGLQAQRKLVTHLSFSSIFDHSVFDIWWHNQRIDSK